MQFYMISNDPKVAETISKIDGVLPFVDLEVTGKAERQGHISSWKSHHLLEDVADLKNAAPSTHLIVRINPWHEESQAEIDSVVDRGANSVMLPMFFAPDTVYRFIEALRGRAVALPLFETKASIAAIPEILGNVELEAAHIGLNDLHLDLKQDFLFQPLADGFLETPTKAFRDAGVKFGIGGIARAREGIVSPEYLLGEHVRLGSTAAILSQTFRRPADNPSADVKETNFAYEIERLRKIYRSFLECDAGSLEKNRIETRDRINDVVRLVKTKAAGNE